MKIKEMMMRRQTENPQQNIQQFNQAEPKKNQADPNIRESKPQLPVSSLRQPSQNENSDEPKKQVKIVEQEPRSQQNEPARLNRAKTTFEEPKGDVSSIRDSWRKQNTGLGSKASEGLFDENSSDEDQDDGGGLFQNNPRVQVRNIYLNYLLPKRLLIIDY